MPSHATMQRLLQRCLALTVIAFVGCTAAFAQQKLNRPLVDHLVTLNTTKGPILIRVYYSVVPYTASNFLNLVTHKFYDGLTFHRVEGWVIQGGDPTGTGKGNYTDPDTGQPRLLKLEVDDRLTHDNAGVVAMARSSDPNSASCQFYILKRPAPQLNGQYAVFGQVLRGMRAVQAIQPGDRILSARITDIQPTPEAASPTGGRENVAPPSGKSPDSGF